MAQGAGHVFQKLVVLVQAREHLGDVAGELPKLFPGAGFPAQFEGAQATLLVDGSGGFCAQPSNAPG